MTTVIIGAALLALSTVSLSQSLNNNFPFKVLTEDFPPYNYQKNGINKGIAVDTLLHIVKAAGYAIENKNIRQIPWARALLMTKSSPEVMLFSTARLPEREALFRWVGPIDTLGNVVIGLKQRNITLKSVEDIHRYKVGVIRTMPREILDSAGFDFDMAEKVDNHAQNIKKLVNGRIDLMIFDLTLSNLSMKKLGLSPDDIEVVYSFNRMDLYYAFNKHADKKIIQRLNVELKKFKQAEEGKQSPFDSLKEKYIGPKANHINYHLLCNREISHFCSELELFSELKLAYDVVK